MHSDPAIERRAAVRGRRRKRPAGPGEGPVFVDSSGRRARLLRRIGLLLGTVCAGYAVVLGLAFMGVGTSVTPASLLPFGGARGQAGPGGAGPGNGAAPTGTPPSPPAGTPGATAAPAPSATS
ncbi:hypothetical protein [Streptomyces capillispiralis]|uniref:Uncharacterized protein n=1 Tax=Streptomyces capillispiralis TaxID=68182 RepID=A0A561TFM0_9ACTN|nr:hypothetical protein [Streptomyces capillispiralis]TWF85914.1 hypothetical protein FHX78_112872 [Streptomyces capillispiralis]GHH89569.1 hypothetical protein GCM10017779_01220 [Streptomyces capillispiralis]